MIRIAICAMAALGLAAMPAHAEVLRVVGTYPAAVDAAASVHQLVIAPFGGRDGEALSFAIEDQLRNATIDGAPWFRIYADNGPGDAILRGFVSLEATTVKVTRERDTCLEQGEGDKCLKKGKKKVDCEQLTYSLAPELRLTARDGQSLYAFTGGIDPSVTVTCPGDRTPPRRSDVLRSLVAKVASRVRNDLIPIERDDEVRVLERRTGLSEEDGVLFKQALKLTKSDPAAACRTWREIAARNPAQTASLFDVALCAESEGRDGAAREGYQALLRLADVSEARDRLGQIEARARASRQLAAHAGR